MIKASKDKRAKLVKEAKKVNKASPVKTVSQLNIPGLALRSRSPLLPELPQLTLKASKDKRATKAILLPMQTLHRRSLMRSLAL